MTTPLFSERYADFYHSKEGGFEEKQYIFVEGNKLPKRFETEEHLVVCELGFGTGLSFMATLDAWKKRTRKNNKLTYLGIEHAPLDYEILKEMYSHLPISDGLSDPFLSWYQNRISTMWELEDEDCALELYFCDVGEALKRIGKATYAIDAWFFDGFSPQKNPEMWKTEILAKCCELSKKSATFSTYSSARIVKDNLQHAGFEGKVFKGYGKKRDALSGRLKSNRLVTEHDIAEQE